MSAEVTNKIFTLPNLISLIRLILVPIFGIVLVVYENNILAFLLFVIAASTDFLDGAIARGMGQVSRLGQQLDPLVDRVLILTAVILVFLIGRVPFWVLLVIVARDLSMLVLVAQLRISGLPKLEVAFIGKAGTAFNMVGFSLLILYWPIVPGLGIVDAAWLPGLGSAEAPLGIWFVYIGMLFAWAAGIYYMIRAYRDSQRPGRPGGGRGKGSTTSRGTKTAAAKHTQNTSQQRNGRYDALQRRYAEEEANSLRQYRPRTTKRQASGRQAPGKKQLAKAKSKTVTHNYARGARGSTQTPALLRVLNTPKKAIAAVAAFLFIILAIGFYSFDAVTNYGVIHAGVKVGTVDVGGKNEQEAAALIYDGLYSRASSDEVILYANEEAAEAGVGDTTVQLGHGVNVYDQTTTDQDATSWSVTLGTIDAEVDGDKLAREAYGVGRDGDFFLGRLAASLFGVTVTPRVEFSTDRLHNVEDMLTKTIGTPMVNADITFDGKQFVAEDGQDGYVVDEEEFEKKLQEAFLSDNRSFVVPMIDRAKYITLEHAETVAESTQAAIAEPVTVSYGEASWSLTTAELGRTITTSVEEDERGRWQLVSHIDDRLLATVLPEVIGHLEDQVAPINASFVVVEEALTVVPEQSGRGVDYARLAKDLNKVIFGITTDDEPKDNHDTKDARTREAQVVIGELKASFTQNDAAAYDFSTMISTYTIEFPWVAEGSAINAQVAADILNSTIIEPQSTWSFNETVGECTEDKGFVPAPIILYDDYVDDLGGGLCNTATAVFNAAYEAGYPIKERTNHSLRNSRYPLGRDAAIAYPYSDLKFENDTDNPLLITMTYTDWTVTCMLWGVPPGYIVESVPSELVEGEEYKTKEVVDETLAPGQSYTEQEGKNASSVDVTRTVYYADGTLKAHWTFYSSYDPTPKIVRIGPSEDPAPTS